MFDIHIVNKNTNMGLNGSGTMEGSRVLAPNSRPTRSVSRDAGDAYVAAVTAYTQGCVDLARFTADFWRKALGA